jgi:hypothetical protein
LPGYAPRAPLASVFLKAKGSWCRLAGRQVGVGGAVGSQGLQYLAVSLLARRSHRDAAICFRRINSTTARRGEGYESARSPRWQPGSRKSWGTPESQRVVVLVHYPLQSAGHANNSNYRRGRNPEDQVQSLGVEDHRSVTHPSAVGRAANDEKFDETEDEVEVDGF